jgi:hypothetical protein
MCVHAISCIHRQNMGQSDIKSIVGGAHALLWVCLLIIHNVYAHDTPPLSLSLIPGRVTLLSAFGSTHPLSSQGCAAVYAALVSLLILHAALLDNPRRRPKRLKISYRPAELILWVCFVGDGGWRIGSALGAACGTNARERLKLYQSK